MNVGSLFTGIGGLDLGLERAGHQIKFQCESVEYRQKILAQHWSNVPLYDDVCTFKDYYDIDVLCGGFPCQDLSISGQRKGLDGKQSGLFYEFLRIANYLVGDGDWILLENVPGLLNSNKGRDFSVLLSELVNSGFSDIAWRILDSRYFGVPQSRRRVFILARRARGVCAAEILFESESSSGNLAPLSEAQQSYQHSLEVRSSATRADSRTTADRDRDKRHPHLASNDIAKCLTTSQTRLDAQTQDFVICEAFDSDRVRAVASIADRLHNSEEMNPKPDNPRYAAIGDAVTVNVAEWLGHQLNRIKGKDE